MSYNNENFNQLFNRVSGVKPLTDIEKNKRSLDEACFLAEVKETEAYLLKNCSNIDEFGEKYFGKKHTQIGVYIRIAQQFGEKQSDGSYVIPDLEYVARYPITLLDEIKKFPDFNGNLEEIENKYEIAPSDSIRSIREKLKFAKGELHPNVDNIKEKASQYESIEIKINRDTLNNFKLACANEGKHYLHVIKEFIIEYTK